MSVYYDLYASGNPQKDEQQPLHARVIPSGTLDAKKFIELVSKSNGFSQATIEGCLQAITDELQHWLKQGWTVEVGELGHFSLSLKCGRPVMEKKEIRSPSIHLNKINLRINKNSAKAWNRYSWNVWNLPTVTMAVLMKTIAVPSLYNTWKNKAASPEQIL